jgi:hypothetical protein
MYVCVQRLAVLKSYVLDILDIFVANALPGQILIRRRTH